MGKKPGKVIGFKVESDRPEDAPKSLAIELAGALQTEQNALADAKAFREQAQRERQKAKEFTGAMTMLREYNRKKEKAIKAGEEWKPSRMEPMESYDMNMIKKERVMLLERSQELINMANECDKIAEEARLHTAKIQKRLMDVK